MKFSISKDLIQKAMQHVGSAIDPKGIVPILSYTKIVAKNKKLFLVATNLDTEASDSIECDIIQEGSLAIPTSTINEIIKKLPANTIITFDASEPATDKAQRLVILAGRGKFEVNSLSDSEFPSIFNTEFDSEISLSIKDLLFMIKNTMSSMSSKTEMYHLNGLLFHTMLEEGGVNSLCVIATDGHRLSFAKNKISESQAIPNLIIPRKSIIELSRILPDYDQNSQVNIKFAKNKVLFTIGTLKYISKLLDADFPNYNKVVPKNNTKILEVHRDNLISAINRVSVVYKMGGARGIKFTIEGNSIILTSSSGFGDMATEDLECVFSEKEKFETSYNPDFIIEALENCSGDKVRFNFSENSAPMLLEGDNKDCYHVVMPMRF